MHLDDLLNKILDAPVGQVENVLSEVFNNNIKLQIIEQSAISPHKFERKVTISSNGLPVIKAQVKFDSSILPGFIMDELLRRKEGIGAILTRNNINAKRKVISVNHNLDEKKVTRKYEVIIDNVVWFTISEEIRLDNLGTTKNS